MRKLPLMDLHRQNFSIKAEIDEAIAQTIENSSFIGGRDKELFEKEFALYCTSQNCIGVANGTDAIFLVLKALGIGAGHEVLTVANSFIASSESITMTGARPQFIDIDPNTFLIDLNKLESLLKNRANDCGRKIKAIIPVHLYGRMVDMPKLMSLANKYQLAVIEDCAQAHGAQIQGKRAGSWGLAGTYSFYPGKNLGAFGDAGAVVTNDEALARKIRMLANHGRIGKYDHEIEGYNSRLDGLQAAILRVKLRHLESWTKRRLQTAQLYNKLLSSPSLIKPQIPNSEEHVFHLYVTRVLNGQRDALKNYLKNVGIETGIHYPIALPNLVAYKYLGYSPQDFPVATQFQNELLSLPLDGGFTDEEIHFISEQINLFFRS